MKKYPHGLTLNAVCAAIDDYQRHEDSVPEEGILAAFNTLLGHSDIVEALRSMERTADANMAAAQAMRDDMYHWKQRAEAAEIEKAGAEERCRMMFDAKNHWSDRARSAEAKLDIEWTNDQCLEFLSIAFRHAEVRGDIKMDDIRLAVKMINAGAKNQQ